MRYITGPLLALVALGGCAGMPTQAGFQQRMQNYMGQPESALVARLGPPQSSYVSGDGSRVLQYTRSSSSQIGGNTTYSPVTTRTTGTVSNNYGAQANYTANTTSYQPTTQPTYTLHNSCTVNFTVDQGGTVRAWNAQGNHCVAPMP